MKKFDVKSALVGFLIGTVGLTTAFAAGGIQSANVSATKVTLDGAALTLKNPIVAVTKDGEKNASMYLPMRELLERLGYTVTWDGAHDTVALTTGSDRVSSPSKAEGMSFSITGSAGERVVASGSMDGEDGLVLTLKITSNVKDSEIDFFLFDPSGKEHHFVISGNQTETIPLSKGTWAYNCSGTLVGKETVKIVGTIDR